MTKKEWDPFTEAEQHLDRYSYFFDQTELDISSNEHSQMLEDFMDENCPQNYCYVFRWIKNSYYTHQLGKIDRILIGVPEDIALAIKIRYGIDPVDASEHKIRKKSYNDDFELYIIRDNV